jgi:hypothetical protein
MMTGWQKSHKMVNQTSLDGFRSIDAKVGHQHHRRIGALDKNEHGPIRGRKRRRRRRTNALSSNGRQELFAGRLPFGCFDPQRYILVGYCH